MKHALLITIWFGKLPSYFPLWVRSLRENEKFDFILFTDQIVAQDKLPENLVVKTVTFEELKERISFKLSLRAKADFPYKLCDFRPAFGEIFSDYLDDYNFWGHCDIDLMFGKLDHFITDEVLLLHKKILNRGHLTLFRNEPLINKMYRSSRQIDYRRIFESAEYFMFDEWHGIHRIFQEFNIEQYHRECIADIDANAARFLCTKIENFKKQIFVWEKGKVMQYFLEENNLKGRELAYIHFQKRKLPITDPKVFSSESIIFHPFGFTPHNGEITRELVIEYDKPNFNHYIQRQSDRLLKKFNLANGPIVFNQSLKKGIALAG